MTVHTLNIGEGLLAKNGKPLITQPGYFSGKALSYAGMPSESCFAISVTWTHWIWSGSNNLYFPISHKQIELFGLSFAVTEVSPAQIKLEQTK